MRFKFSLLILVGVAVVCSGMSEAAPMRKTVPQGASSFVSQAEHFSIWLPTQPKKNSGVWSTTISTEAPTSAPNKIIYYHVVATPRRSRTDNFTIAPAELLLVEKNYLGFSRLVSREDIKLGQFAGLNLTTSDSSGSYITRRRFYSTPQFIYQISVGGYKAPMQQQAVQIDRVLDSFRVLPQ